MIINMQTLRVTYDAFRRLADEGSTWGELRVAGTTFFHQALTIANNAEFLSVESRNEIYEMHQFVAQSLGLT